MRRIAAMLVLLALPCFAGDIPEILRDAITERRYEGFVSLEPHLAIAGQFAGFSGPDLFKKAVQALKKILDGMGVAYE